MNWFPQSAPRLLLPLALAASLTNVSTSQDAPEVGPFCRAESSGFTATSTLKHVEEFLEAIRALDGGASFEVERFGSSKEDRPMWSVRVPCTGNLDDPLRVVILANIHGGEVCGKEAVQILIREWARGEHSVIRQACELVVVPIYNVDGNEKIAVNNRSNVNGPVGGLGERANAEGFDLNRDFVKAVAPETRALLGLLNAEDPHAFFDLHTTNGAPHGFDLTYAPSLSPNTDPDLTNALVEQIFPAVRERMDTVHGYKTFDYGNFSRSEPVAYQTFDHRPRFATNYVGLRNCFSILSEAYAYEPFELRVRATRAFVLECLNELVGSADQVKALCAQAEARCFDGEALFGTETTLVDGPVVGIPTRAWDRMPLPTGGTRVMRRSEIVPREVLLRVRFEAQTQEEMPKGWVIPQRSSTQILETLRAHGVLVQQMAEGQSIPVRMFVPESGDRAQRPFQGVRNVTLRGSWQDGTFRTHEATYFIPSAQRLGRVAAQLLEPLSEDGLVTWGFLYDYTEIKSDSSPGRFPILRRR
ncbi:MAG: M14 family metallopeptidase [Planctomycetota bacterium]